MKIEIDKRQDGVLAACINIGKYQFRFGVYQWPWVKIEPGCYMSTVGAIVDFGILPWLFYGKALDQEKGWNGYGYPYKTLRDAVRSWNVDIIGYKDGEWFARTRR